MDNIFNEKVLNITENGSTYQYNCKSDANGLPNYYPPAEKINESMDEILFIPIEKADFNSDKNVYRFGLRYTIQSHKDPNFDNNSDIDLVLKIRRIRYEITNASSITINKVYDPLHIPRVIHINKTTNTSISSVLNIVNNIIAENNKWYLDKHI